MDEVHRSLKQNLRMTTTKDSKDVIPIHDAKHLFANVLRSLQRPNLHKVLVAPSARELVVTPRVVDGKQRQVVSLGLVKLGFLLISKSLFVLDNHQKQRPVDSSNTLQLAPYTWMLSNSRARIEVKHFTSLHGKVQFFYQIADSLIDKANSFLDLKCSLPKVSL